MEENDEEKHNVLAISLIGQTHFLQLEGEEMSPIGVTFFFLTLFFSFLFFSFFFSSLFSFLFFSFLLPLISPIFYISTKKPSQNPGDLILNEQTIFCGNITPELMLQITPFEIVSFDATNLGVKGRWKVGEEEEAGRINVCSSSGGQVLVGTGSGKVFFFLFFLHWFCFYDLLILWFR